jgi:putative serine protease PepD
MTNDTTEPVASATTGDRAAEAVESAAPAAAVTTEASAPGDAPTDVWAPPASTPPASTPPASTADAVATEPVSVGAPALTDVAPAAAEGDALRGDTSTLDIPAPEAAPAYNPYAAPAPAPVPAPGDASIGGGGPYGPYGAPEPTPRRSRGPRTGAILVVATVLALLAGLLGGVLGYGIANQADTRDATDPSVVLPQAPSGDTSDRPSDSIAGIAAKSLPAVVSLAVRGPAEQGTGSGFVIRSNGYILTNNHVVEAAATGGSITVSFQDGTTAPATIVGRDSSYDLAVVKVEENNLPVLPLGNSNDVVVGDSAIAVGSPLGLSGTVTAGIVSALNRPVTAGGSGSGETSFINAIQTDAAINPGNSGGPLLNAGGEVIGINSAIATLGGRQGQQGGSIGVGFAIPVNQARITAEQIIRTGTSTKPVIGVTLDLGFAGPGVRISQVPEGPASAAGVQAGDVVTEIDGRPVNGADEFIVAIRAKQPGDTVTLTIDRNGSTSDVTVTLGSETSGN